VGGFSPMLSQNHHFWLYALEKLPYAIDRYLNKTKWLYEVVERQLTRQEFVAGAYSIADMAIVGWASLWERRGVSIGLPACDGLARRHADPPRRQPRN
jgi:GST-like protein